MISILLPIWPRFCELIASGLKTIEVRKTIPKIDTPFKVYIYQSKPKKIPFYCDILRQAGKENTAELLEHSFGKVIGEFVCREIIKLNANYSDYSFHLQVDEKDNENAAEEIMKKSCLSLIRIHDYLNSRTGYAWHISDLVIYNKPKELSEFNFARPPQSWCYVKEAA